MKALAGLLGVVLLGFLTLATPARAYNIAFCVTVTVTYTDSSNMGSEWALLPGPSPETYEDNWWTPTAAREPRGARYELRNYQNILLQSGYLDDGFGTQGAGCTANYTGTLAPTSMKVYSYGSVQSNWMYSYDSYQAVDSMTVALSGVPQSGTPYPVLFAPSGISETRVWAGYVGGAYALYRHAGGETGNYFQFYLCQCTGSGATCTEVGTPGAGCACDPDENGNGCSASNNTNGSMNAGNGSHLTSVFTTSGIRRKFTLVHEMGHIMANKVTNGVANGGDCTDTDVDPCYEEGSGSHAFWSRELDRCAFKEAFADFYAADVWNDHNEDNCAFKYYKENIYTTFSGGAAFDCAGDDGPDSGTTPDDFTNYQQGTSQVAYIEQCTATWFFFMNYYGHGTELDWLRVLWNIHTDGASPPSYTTIVRWIRDCGSLGNSTAFSQLDTCANSLNNSLETNWNIEKDVHTIDYTD